MSRVTGLVLEPELAASAPRRPPVPACVAAAPAAQPRMEMVAGVGLMFPAQAQQHRSRLAQQHALSEQLIAGQLAVARLVAAHLAAYIHAAFLSNNTACNRGDQRIQAGAHAHEPMLMSPVHAQSIKIIKTAPLQNQGNPNPDH